MNDSPVASLVLIGVGGAGTAAVRAARRLAGGAIRAIAIDTDAASGTADDIDFALLGGNRLAGRGSGGMAGAVRAAFLDDPSFIDRRLDGVRTAAVVACLGGGTADGATAELLKRLHSRGIVSIVFATLPFRFEGEERAREAKAALGQIAAQADATAALPLDNLVADAGTDDFGAALARATETVAAGATLFWRLAEHPGYIALGTERLRAAAASAGTMRFAAVRAAGENRASAVLDALRRSALLDGGAARKPIRRILLGIMAGDDLRLSEIGEVAHGVQTAFGPNATLDLGTVNDETVFSGELAVVAMLFEENATSAPSVQPGEPRRRRLSAAESALASGGDRFGGSEKTFWNEEDLDIPTYLRRNLTLER